MPHFSQLHFPYPFKFQFDLKTTCTLVVPHVWPVRLRVWLPFFGPPSHTHTHTTSKDIRTRTSRSSSSHPRCSSKEQWQRTNSIRGFRLFRSSHLNCKRWSKEALLTSSECVRKGRKRAKGISNAICHCGERRNRHRQRERGKLLTVVKGAEQSWERERESNLFLWSNKEEGKNFPFFVDGVVERNYCTS